MTRRRVLSIVTVAAGTMLICAGSFLQCGPSEGEAEAGTDAALDRLRPLDVMQDNASSDACSVPAGDWPGYVRFTAIGACARTDVPLDASVLPAMNWITCKDQRPACLEMAVTWPGTGYGQYFGRASVGKNGQQQPSILSLDYPPDYAQEETVLYDFNTLKAITSWRFAGNLQTDVPVWVYSASLGTALVAVGASNRVIVGTGSLANLLAGNGLTTMSTTLVPIGTGPQFEDISDTTFAFDTGASGLVDRVSIGTGNYVAGHSPALLSRPVVHGDDVFAFASQGTDGWARYYRVDADGGVVDFANKLQHYISGLAADAQNVYWVDAYGAPQPTDAQPNAELWSAPYSADWSTVSGSAMKLATISGSRISNAVAFNGYWAGLVGVTDVWIVRSSDGTSAHLVPEPGRRFNEVAYVDDKEVWVIEDAVNDAGSLSVGGVAFERIGYSF